MLINGSLVIYMNDNIIFNKYDFFNEMHLIILKHKSLFYDNKNNENLKYYFVKISSINKKAFSDMFEILLYKMTNIIINNMSMRTIFNSSYNKNISRIYNIIYTIQSNNILS